MPHGSICDSEGMDILVNINSVCGINKGLGRLGMSDTLCRSVVSEFGGTNIIYIFLFYFIQFVHIHVHVRINEQKYKHKYVSEAGLVLQYKILS